MEDNTILLEDPVFMYLFLIFSKMLQEYVHYILLHLFTLKKIDAIDVVAVATHHTSTLLSGNSMDYLPNGTC
jgi:hypothetical protein